MQVNSLGDMLDALAGAFGALTDLINASPHVGEDANMALARRNIKNCIDFLLKKDTRYMTPQEAQKMRDELTALRNGGV